MLIVKTPEEVFEIINSVFGERMETEEVSLSDALGRVLSEDVCSTEHVPGFDRSTVDGYAVKASDTFGCSDSIPVVLSLLDEIRMGEEASECLKPGEAAYIPTGGELPKGADGVLMVEYSELYGDGTVGVLCPVSPGENVIFRGDDIRTGERLLSKGSVLNTAQIGALAAIGKTNVPVKKKLSVGILSTGDELVPSSDVPGPGQVRDVNSRMLESFVIGNYAEAVCYGIIRDDKEEIGRTLDIALSECDLVLISGGSSAGLKDTTAKIIEERGELLFHGIAMKPGKPTILGNAGGKPVMGLPGHPGAAFFVAQLFVTALLDRLYGRKQSEFPVKAVLSERVPSNHGRAQYVGVSLREENGILFADPVHSKSGLITTIARVCGYFAIDRDREGLEKGEEIEVWRFSI
ncbi:MAG: molybdopterin molybdotransferase MoeA [Lachnospiraceae bacterium]|nr:molybdopterin molybdotransferase MoeA [Lachnospiraceae bacterium]